MKRRERSFYGPALQAHEKKLLAEVPRGAELAEEIVLLRLGILRMAEKTDPANNEDALEANQLMVRMLELLTRMVNVQARVGDQGNNDLAELNELVRQRLAAGLKHSPTAKPGRPGDDKLSPT